MLSEMSKIGYELLAALDPLERLSAMRRLSSGGGGGGSVFTNKWFILMGASIVFILTIFLLAIRRFRIDKEMEALDLKFDEYANNHGLSSQERKILSGITKKALLRRKDAIFTIMAAFNRGAIKFMQEKFASIHNPVERQKLNAMVDSVREKLGYKRKVYTFGARSGGGRGLSSRQIPVGKKVSIAPSSSPDVARIDAVIMRSDELEFVVAPEVPLSSAAGKLWNVRYRFGAATWDFNVLTIACVDEGLVLNHSDNITFVNRRRFLRVAVQRPALVAHFPTVRSDFEGGPMTPEFVRGTVTELSGPGLRIESEIEVHRGDRVIVVFELEDGKVVQDIGEVRGYRDRGEEHSIGVELIGLNEAGVDELVRVTNNIAISCAIEESRDAEESVLVAGRSSG